MITRKVLERYVGGLKGIHSPTPQLQKLIADKEIELASLGGEKVEKPLKSREAI